MTSEADTGDPIAAWLAATGGDAPKPRRDRGSGERPDGIADPTAEAGASTEQASPRSSRRLLVLASIPWVGVLLLGAAWVGQGGAVADGLATSPPADVPVEEGAAQPVRPDADGGHAESAAAVMAVRATATATQYIDASVVENFTALSDSAGVVTVRSVMLTQAAGAWGDPQVVRHAVVVGPAKGPSDAAEAGEIVALSPPWSLPAPAAARPRLGWMAVDDAALLDTAKTSLIALGYTDIADLALRRTETVPEILAAQFSGGSPAQPSAAPREVWLAADATPLSAQSAAVPLPLPVPAEQP